MEFRPQIDSLRYEEDPEVASSNINPTYHQTLTGAYGAYFIPKTYNPLNPQPFRADSPYQQLIDTRTIHDSLLSRYRGSMKGVKSEGKKVLCYLTNWSFYRVKEGKFIPELLNSKLCSHIIYSFGKFTYCICVCFKLNYLGNRNFNKSSFLYFYSCIRSNHTHRQRIR